MPPPSLPRSPSSLACSSPCWFATQMRGIVRRGSPVLLEDKTPSKCTLLLFLLQASEQNHHFKRANLVRSGVSTTPVENSFSFAVFSFGYKSREGF